MAPFYLYKNSLYEVETDRSTCIHHVVFHIKYEWNQNKWKWHGQKYWYFYFVACGGVYYNSHHILRVSVWLRFCQLWWVSDHFSSGLFSFEDEWPVTATASWHQAECFKKPRQSSDFVAQKKPWLLFIMIGWLSKQSGVMTKRVDWNISVILYVCSSAQTISVFRYLYFEKYWTN